MALTFSPIKGRGITIRIKWFRLRFLGGWTSSFYILPAFAGFMQLFWGAWTSWFYRESMRLWILALNFCWIFGASAEGATQKVDKNKINPRTRMLQALPLHPRRRSPFHLHRIPLPGHPSKAFPQPIFHRALARTAAEKVNEHTPAPRPPELNGNPSLRIREKKVVPSWDCIGNQACMGGAASLIVGVCTKAWERMRTRLALWRGGLYKTERVHPLKVSQIWPRVCSLFGWKEWEVSIKRGGCTPWMHPKQGPLAWARANPVAAFLSWVLSQICH